MFFFLDGFFVFVFFPHFFQLNLVRVDDIRNLY